MDTGLVDTLAVGAMIVALIGWLCARANVWSRRAGMWLAVIVAGYCGAVALILVVGAVDAGDSLRSWGGLSVTVLVLIACAAAFSVRRSLPPHSTS